MYYMVQFTTALILILAANTSFADFPRLSSILAGDRFLPRQLGNLGDKLVFSNGILLLGFFSSVLIVIFNGDTHALIPLYAVGVFTAFTLSQSGMVKHWISSRKKGMVKGILINGIGAITTAVVLGVIAFEKFAQGAWVIFIAIPFLVFVALKIQRHYLSIADQLSIKGPMINGSEFTHHSVLIPVSGMHRAVLGAIRYAKSLTSDIEALYVDINPAATEKMRADWQKYETKVPLLILDSPYRSITEPILDHIAKIRSAHEGGIITVVLPEFVPSRWWHHLLHNQTALLLKSILLFEKDVVAISVPLHLKK
jgi:hypothetical protein